MFFKKNDKYVSNYFFIAKKIIEKEKQDSIVTLQFFQRKDNVLLAGMNEALAFLEKNTNTKKYEIFYLQEGSIINNLEPVLVIRGKYKYFGIYEGVIDGILSRSTSIATNARKCILAAKTKEVIFMGDRGDHYTNQEVDGYAIEVSGMKRHSTLAGARGNKEVLFGSVPHVLIQHFKGDTAEAMKAYVKHVPEESTVIALVDFNNNVIKDSLEVLSSLGKKLGGVRIDTSANMIDHMFDDKPVKHNGVNIEQVFALRKALDDANGKHVKIIVSSGFSEEKISDFEKHNAPVDSYGVGAWILKINTHFSADAVIVDGHKIAKEGRYFIENKKLQKYTPGTFKKWKVSNAHQFLKANK